MSSETSSPSSNQLKLGLAFVAGIGLTIMVIAAGIGVIGGVENSALGLLFAVGTAMLITGIIVWFAVERPDAHFDDINEAQYHGHDDH